MNISVEQLAALKYQGIEEFDHEDFIPFLKKCMGNHNLVTISFKLFNVALMAIFMYELFITDSDVGMALSMASMGLLLFFVVLLPLHEFIHGLAYKAVGATKVTYHAILKKMVFYAMADRFVASRSEFYIVALAPFTLINALLISGCFFLAGNYPWISWGALIMHTSGCYGDFGLVSFFYVNRNNEVVTYDDGSLKKSFFLIRN